MNDFDKATREDLLIRMEEGWRELQTFIRAYPEPLWYINTDAAGWTAKDHLIHLAMWEGSMAAALSGDSIPKSMGVSDATYATIEQGSYDELNAAIQQRYKNLDLSNVRYKLKKRHDALISKIGALTDADLHLPFSHFQPNKPDKSHPILAYIVGNTFEHYAEHIPWMRAILEAE